MPYGQADFVQQSIGERMDKIAVIIPCYNEGVTIEKVIKDFKKELPEAEIYVSRGDRQI